MPRPKKTTSRKEPVRLRMKELADGSQSLYLDMYRDGKRSYEFLKMYIIPATDPDARARNDATLRAANAIKSRRIIELANGEAGLRNTRVRSKALLLDWMERYKAMQSGKGKSVAEKIDKTAKQLRLYRPKARMHELDREFCLGFIDHMRTKYLTRAGKPLSPMSCIDYLSCLRAALNAAVRMDLLSENPLNRLTPAEKPRMPESKREFLTIDEVRLLADTPCGRDDIKRAFMFSCHCGLRIGDVTRLRWQDISDDGGQWRVCIVMQKTKEPLYIPLSNQARRWMPERGEAADGDRVFPTVPSGGAASAVVRRWAEAAGIAKRVTFHTSRHTYATMLLTLGADLYTVSKLLGHSKVETTQIYAKIIDRKKDDAIGLIDREFGGGKDKGEISKEKNKRTVQQP